MKYQRNNVNNMVPMVANSIMSSLNPMTSPFKVVRALKISLDFRFYDFVNFSEKWR